MLPTSAVRENQQNIELDMVWLSSEGEWKPRDKLYHAEETLRKGF